jgi:hypothetical protein
MDRQRLHQSALTSRLPQFEAKASKSFIARAAGGLAHESNLGAKAHRRVTVRRSPGAPGAMP